MTTIPAPPASADAKPAQNDWVEETVVKVKLLIDIAFNNGRRAGLIEAAEFLEAGDIEGVHADEAALLRLLAAAATGGAP